MNNLKETEVGKIPRDWDVYKIGEIADVTKLAGFEYTDCFEYVDDGEIIALRALNVRDGILDLSDVKRIHKKISDKLIRSKLFKDDILFTYVGANIGQFAIVTENDKYHLAPNICRIRTSPKCNSYYLYCYFRTNYFQDNLTNFSVGSSQPTMPMGNIRQIPVPLPPDSEQLAIVASLSAMDDKIDLLHRQNKTLEALAGTLFRQWFVEKAEEGWDEKGLDGIADFMNGLPCQKYPPVAGVESLPVIKIKELRQGTTEASDMATSEVPEKYIVKNGDILFSWSGSLEVIIWSHGKGILNQHLFKVTSEAYPEWFFYFWLKHHLSEFRNIARDKATTMGHIQRHHLSDALVVIPSPDKMKDIDAKISPIFNKMKRILPQVSTLTRLRDTLLPKLMSGEVRVKN